MLSRIRWKESERAFDCVYLCTRVPMHLYACVCARAISVPDLPLPPGYTLTRSAFTQPNTPDLSRHSSRHRQVTTPALFPLEDRPQKHVSFQKAMRSGQESSAREKERWGRSCATLYFFPRSLTFGLMFFFYYYLNISFFLADRNLWSMSP